jgi:hypothetical protein
LTATATRTAISLELGHQACKDFAGPLYLQLSNGAYGECSVLPIPQTLGEWRDEHRTARKRADRSHRLGYRFSHIDRERFSEDIYAVNTSLERRQGKPMSNGYRQRTTFGKTPDYGCDRHQVRTYGVLRDHCLYAYLWLYQAGDLALVSSILGHGDHLKNDVMYLLAQGVIGELAGSDGFLIYNRHDSGTDGLRYFKERLGFRAENVEWLP